MKIIFFGTSDFAIASLKNIMESNHELPAVVTQPDRKKGRGLVVSPPPVKMVLKDSSIPLYQPTDLSDPRMINILRKYNADLFVVVSFGQILKKEVLDIPKIFCVNLHASLLPKYRGAAPINWAIMNGDKASGVTTIKMDEGMDSGDIILKREADILDKDTSETLGDRLSKIGAGLLIETIDLLERNQARFTRQNKEWVSFAYKLKKRDGLIDWSMPSQDIHNKVRGLMPWPGAYTHWKGRLLKIWESEFNETPLEGAKIGSILNLDNGIIVGTGNGELIIRVLQLEGGKKLKASDFLRGHKIRIGDRFK